MMRFLIRFMLVYMIFFFGVFLQDARSSERVYNYISLFEEFSWLSFHVKDSGVGVVRYGNSVSWPIAVCDESSQFICIKDGENFAFPRFMNSVQAEDEWEFGDFSYSVIGVISNDLLGRKGDFFVIDRNYIGSEIKEKVTIRRYVYSRKFGIIASGIVIKERNTIPEASRLLPDMRDFVVISGEKGILHK